MKDPKKTGKKNILKTIGKILLWILAVILILLLALPLWIGPVVKGVANAIVPDKVGADFKLNEFSLNPYSGTLHVGDMKLANPEGFKKENCVELGALDVNVAMTTVLSKKICIEEIVLDGLTVAASGDFGNFRKIAENAAGEEEAVAEKPAEEKPEVAEKPAEKEAEVVEAEEKSEGPRVQIDRLVLKNLKVKIGILPIPLPTITLEGIGADKEEGASMEDVWKAVSSAVMKAMGAIGDLGKNALKLGQDAAEKAADAAAEAVEATAEVATEAAKAAGEAAGKAAEAAADAAGSAVKSIKGLFGK